MAKIKARLSLSVEPRARVQSFGILDSGSQEIAEAEGQVQLGMGRVTSL